MNCDEYENRILADPERPISAEESAAAEKHLAVCTACQARVRQFQQLDATLMIKLRAPVLSADFNQRLAKRIQTEVKVLSAAERAERKRQLQLEFATGLAQLHHRPWSQAGLVAGLSYALPLAMAGWFAWLLLPRLVSTLAPALVPGLAWNILFASVAAMVFLAIGLAAAFPRRVRNLWPGR